MKFVTFTHANTKREVLITVEHVYAIQFSSAHQATHIISTGGAIVPVAESVETARGRIYNNNGQTMAENGAQEAQTDGT